MGKALLKRAPLLLVVAVALLVWKGGFGLFPTDRSIVWRLPVSYAAVHRVRLELWEGAALLEREERTLGEKGLTDELRSRLPLRRGAHRAVATVWDGQGVEQSWTLEFDPREDATVVLTLGR